MLALMPIGIQNDKIPSITLNCSCSYFCFLDLTMGINIDASRQSYTVGGIVEGAYNNDCRS